MLLLEGIIGKLLKIKVLRLKCAPVTGVARGI